MFVSNIYTCAKKIRLEDNNTSPKVIKDLNAFAIKHDTVNTKRNGGKTQGKKKEVEKDKKDRQEIIEKQLLNIRPPPPHLSLPVLCTSDKTGLDILSSVSESVINSNNANNIDNQIVNPPHAKEVVIDAEKEKKQDEKMPTRPKMKNSSLVQGGDSKKPSLIKNQIKFRSNDMINLINEIIPSIKDIQHKIKGFFSEKEEDASMKKLAYLERLILLYINLRLMTSYHQKYSAGTST